MKREPLSPAMEKVFSVSLKLMKYHQYQLVGSDYIPREGRCMIVASHSLATYDSFFLGAAVYQKSGRILKGLAHDHLFDIPILRDLVKKIDLVRANEENAKMILSKNHILGLTPGGLREALRSSDYRYQVWWNDRKGFVKLAIETQTPIIVAICPKADDIFTIYPHWITELAYEKLRFPIPLFRGIGPTFIPRPIQLTHYLSAPLVPPKIENKDGEIDKNLIDHFHRQILDVATELAQNP